MTDDDAQQVLAELDPQPAHEVIPVSRRQTLRALASVGALTTVGSASGQSAGTVRADEAYFANYGWEPSAEGGTLTIDGDEYTFDGGEEIGLDDGSVGTELVTPSGQASELIGPSGQVLWSWIPDSVVDNFEEPLYEEQNKTLSDYWTGSVSTWTRQTTTVQEGQYAVEDSTGVSEDVMTRDSPNLTRPFTVSYWTNVSGGSAVDGSFTFSTTQPTHRDALSGYSVYHYPGTNKQDSYLRRYDNGSIATTDTYNTGVQEGVWHKYTVEFGTSDITLSVDGTVAGTITDSTYDNLYVGFIDFSGAARYDDIRRPNL